MAWTPNCIAAAYSGPRPRLRGDIRLEDVRFSYERGKEVIKGISLHVRPGEMVGLVGRSGRGASAGRAIIQTLTPENEIIRLAALQDYEAFYRTEIRLRKSLIYPPYCDLCVIGVTGAQETLVKAAAHNALDVVRQLTADAFSDQKLIVLGPMPARIAKISNKYRYRLILKCRNSRRLRAMIAQLLRTVGKDSRFADVTVYADINPDTAV